MAGHFIPDTNFSIDGNNMLGGILGVVVVGVLQLTVIVRKKGGCGSYLQTLNERESVVRSFRVFGQAPGLVVGWLFCPPVT